MYKDYFFLGKITKLFGISGYFFVYLDTDEPEKYSQLDAVFVDCGGELIPYIIEDFQYRGANQAVLKFKDTDYNFAKALVKSDLYLPLSMLPPLTGNCFYFHEVIDFQVVDKEKGNIGRCKNFYDVTSHLIMQVDFDGIEIFIPVVDECFESVDRENKIIYITAPNGLIDIYLE